MAGVTVQGRSLRVSWASSIAISDPNKRITPPGSEGCIISCAGRQTGETAIKQESSGKVEKRRVPDDGLDIAMGSAYAMPNKIGREH